MKKLLVALLLVSTPVLAQNTPAQMAAEINTQLPTNHTGAITADILRQVLFDMNSVGLARTNNLSDLLDISAARTNLGLSQTEIPLSRYCVNLGTNAANITTCLQSAVAQSAIDGSCVRIPALPAGVTQWTISSPIVIGNGTTSGASSVNNVCIKGAGSSGLYGSYGSYITWTGVTSADMFTVAGPINNVTIEGLNLNGGNIAGRLIDLKAVRFSRIRDVWGAGCTVACVDIEGQAASGQLNIMLDLAYLYMTTTQAGAHAIKLDGVLANSTDTWLSTIRNSRFESTGGSGGRGIFIGLSDNILWNQIHAVGPTSGCAVEFNAMTSGNGGNSFPKGHLFVKSAWAAPSGTSTCTTEDGTHTIGINNFIDFGTTDTGETVPTHYNLRGTTDNGQSFNGYGNPQMLTLGGALAANTGTFYLNQSFTGGVTGAQSWASITIPRIAFLTSASCRVNVAPGTSQTYTYTVLKNGSTTGITGAISGAGTSVILTGFPSTYGAAPIQFAAGDKLDVQEINSATAAASNHNCSLLMQ